MTSDPGRDALCPGPAATTAALAARKAQILADLQRTMARRRATRLAVRAAGAAAITAALAIPAALGLATFHRRPPAPAAASFHTAAPPRRPLTPTFIDATTPSSAPSRSTLHVEIITDPPDILTRCAVTGDPASIPLLSDDDLLAALAEAGRPAGLIRIQGRALLVSHSQSSTRPLAPPAGDGSLDPQGV